MGIKRSLHYVIVRFIVEWYSRFDDLTPEKYDWKFKDVRHPCVPGHRDRFAEHLHGLDPLQDPQRWQLH